MAVCLVAIMHNTGVQCNVTQLIKVEAACGVEKKRKAVVGRLTPPPTCCFPQRHQTGWAARFICIIHGDGVCVHTHTHHR